VYAVLSMLDWEEHDSCGILEIHTDQESGIDEISHLCCPQIAAITSPQNSRQRYMGDPEAFAEIPTGLLRSIPKDGWAVLNGDDPWLRLAARDCSAKIVWVGRRRDCDVVAKHVHCQDGRLVFDLDGRPFELPECGRDYLFSALVVCAIGRLFGVPTRQLQRALQTRLATTPPNGTNHKSREVPSSALALREADATLPPGLERYAC
jgi:UDP-N-acetylmuramoyl-tripeptide--D-alanyl-D-alanine ligase